MSEPLTLEQLARWNGWITSEEEFQKRQEFFREYEERLLKATEWSIERSRMAMQALRD